MLTAHPAQARRAAWAIGLLVAVAAAFAPLTWVLGVVFAVGVLAARRWLLAADPVNAAIVVVAPFFVLFPWSLHLLTDPIAFLSEAGLQTAGPDHDAGWRRRRCSRSAPAALACRRSGSPSGSGSPWSRRAAADPAHRADHRRLGRGHRRLPRRGAGQPGQRDADRRRPAGRRLARESRWRSRRSGCCWRPRPPPQWLAGDRLERSARSHPTRTTPPPRAHGRRPATAAPAGCSPASRSSPRRPRRCSSPLYWVKDGVQGPVGSVTAPLLPAFVSASSTSGQQYRTLILRPERQRARLHWSSGRATRPSASPSSAPTRAAGAALSRQVAALGAPDGADAGDPGLVLGSFGIRWVLLPGPVDPVLAQRLDAVARPGRAEQGRRPTTCGR